jgi:hypothetical protein
MPNKKLQTNDLKLDRLLVDGDSAKAEIYADGADVAVGEVIVLVEKKTRRSDASENRA